MQWRTDLQQEQADGSLLCRNLGVFKFDCAESDDFANVLNLCRGPSFQSKSNPPSGEWRLLPQVVSYGVSLAKHRGAMHIDVRLLFVSFR
ncbi:hypothetical protein B0E41_02840 [Hydrogenophaga sp. A37]|nr:hypothetical protein B0E41_02840 [Hydrogenophaga sp. A37]